LKCILTTKFGKRKRALRPSNSGFSRGATQTSLQLKEPPPRRSPFPILFFSSRTCAAVWLPRRRGFGVAAGLAAGAPEPLSDTAGPTAGCSFRGHVTLFVRVKSANSRRRSTPPRSRSRGRTGPAPPSFSLLVRSHTSPPRVHSSRHCASLFLPLQLRGKSLPRKSGLGYSARRSGGLIGRPPTCAAGYR